ncbi:MULTISPECIES: hypothetical protein [unclassified Streptomyces]|uniref:hypothetical protein n=1 Tax=unclassified Streptomyces TaxID=2593676 RepID=UPI002E10BC07|nr:MULTISPECIES: hypothetical protein [unclassified Streptomyces]WSR23723.1 hypothetical protein OG573_34720 [Streptomyces sp. NBC_01205]
MLEFRSSSHAHRPVIEALTLVAQYANAGNTTYYLLGETVPVLTQSGPVNWENPEPVRAQCDAGG